MLGVNNLVQRGDKITLYVNNYLFSWYGGFVYVATMLNLYTREIVDWHIGPPAPHGEPGHGGLPRRYDELYESLCRWSAVTELPTRVAGMRICSL